MRIVCFWRDSVCFAPPAGSAQPQTLTALIQRTAPFVSSLLKTAKQTGGGASSVFTPNTSRQETQSVCVGVYWSSASTSRSDGEAKTNENLHFRSENISQRLREGN